MEILVLLLIPVVGCVVTMAVCSHDLGWKEDDAPSRRCLASEKLGEHVDPGSGRSTQE